MNYLTIAGSAIGNKCSKWHIRESQFSETGYVLVAKFKDFNKANEFARKWAKLTGSVKIRFDNGFNASIPVDKPYFLN
jgi:hypothetical protein